MAGIDALNRVTSKVRRRNHDQDRERNENSNLRSRTCPGCGGRRIDRENAPGAESARDVDCVGRDSCSLEFPVCRPLSGKTSRSRAHAWEGPGLGGNPAGRRCGSPGSGPPGAMNPVEAKRESGYRLPGQRCVRNTCCRGLVPALKGSHVRDVPVILTDWWGNLLMGSGRR